MKSLFAIFLLIFITGARTLGETEDDPEEQLESLLEDETGIADPYTSEDMDELPELFDSASFGDEDEDGSGVTPRPPRPRSCKRLCPGPRCPLGCVVLKCRRICRFHRRFKLFCLRRCICLSLCPGPRCPRFCQRKRGRKPFGDEQSTAYVEDESTGLSQSAIN